MSIAISLFIFINVALVTCATGQSRGIHLSWNGKSNVNTTTSMAVSWIGTDDDDGVIRYGTDSTRLTAKVTARRVISSALDRPIFKATLKRLRPDTRYYYRIGSAGANPSPVYHFQTGAPSSGHRRPTVVGVWGDTQDNGENLQFEQTEIIAQQMRRYPLDFTLHMGDMVENGSVTASWKKFYEVTEPLNAVSPMMAIVGNHDVGNDSLEGGFQRPFPVFYAFSNLPRDQLNYSFDYGITHFVALNSGFASAASEVGKLHYAPGSEAYKWLEADLKRARANAGTKWIVLYCHYPLFSYGASNVKAWKDQLQPLLDKYQVDLVLSGHRHVYERHFPIEGDTVRRGNSLHAFLNPEGTIYITNGSAGGSIQGLGGSALESMAFTATYKSYTYGIMEITRNCIHYRVFDEQGNAIDHVSIIKTF